MYTRSPYYYNKVKGTCLYANIRLCISIVSCRCLNKYNTSGFSIKMFRKSIVSMGVCSNQRKKKVYFFGNEIRGAFKKNKFIPLEIIILIIFNCWKFYVRILKCSFLIITSQFCYWFLWKIYLNGHYAYISLSLSYFERIAFKMVIGQSLMMDNVCMI
jgi:hypothetical protein